MKYTKLGDAGYFTRDSFWEWFIFKANHKFLETFALPIPKGYVPYFWDSHRDTEYYCFFLLWPFLKLKILLQNGFKIWRVRMYLDIPSRYTFSHWKIYKQVGEGEITQGAFFINKSGLIYALCLPPLVIKYYKPYVIPKTM